MSSFAVRTVAGQACKGVDRMDTIVDPDNGYTVLGWELVRGDRSAVIRADGDQVIVTLGYLGSEVGRGTFTDIIPSLIVPFVNGHLVGA